jgi:hypothetical protein
MIDKKERLKIKIEIYRKRKNKMKDKKERLKIKIENIKKRTMRTREEEGRKNDPHNFFLQKRADVSLSFFFQYSTFIHNVQSKTKIF